MSIVTSIEVDLAIVGAGMAGMCAAFFAAQAGLSTAQVGGASELVYASGLWDLLGVHPIAERKRWASPWEGIRALVADVPNHPYGRAGEQDLRAGIGDLLLAFEQAGNPYRRVLDSNSEFVTSLGTVKTTYCLPQTMWNGVRAWTERLPCLIVDFHGMKDFSAAQIRETLGPVWPKLRACRIAPPGRPVEGEVSTEYLALSLDLPGSRDWIVGCIREKLGDAQCVGFPAVLGYHKSLDAWSDLEGRLGVPVFEIPTPPPSVPGLRMLDTFEGILRNKGVRQLHHLHVAGSRWTVQEGFELDVGSALPGHDAVEHIVHAKGVILATGRFLGGGLSSNRLGIRETLFGLPVWQPAARGDWHRPSMLDPRGHPVNQSGLEVDELLRPLNAEGHCAFPTLFAAGSILAHQDWMRSKSGSGIAVATARGAVNGFIQEKSQDDR